MITLTDLAPGESGRVLGFAEASPYVERLQRLGLTPGTLVTMVRCAPLGDPVQIRCRGFALALRRTEASAMELERA